MFAGTIEFEEVLMIGMVDQIAVSFDEVFRFIDEVIETVFIMGLVVVKEVKSLTDFFDCWMGTDEELREWVLDKISEMRVLVEG